MRRNEKHPPVFRDEHWELRLWMFLNKIELVFFEPQGTEICFGPLQNVRLWLHVWLGVVLQRDSLVKQAGSTFKKQSLWQKCSDSDIWVICACWHTWVRNFNMVFNRTAGLEKQVKVRIYPPHIQDDLWQRKTDYCTEYRQIHFSTIQDAAYIPEQAVKNYGLYVPASCHYEDIVM